MNFEQIYTNNPDINNVALFVEGRYELINSLSTIAKDSFDPFERIYLYTSFGGRKEELQEIRFSHPEN